MKWTELMKRVWILSQDPVTRQRAALDRAKQKGIARMMEPLERALADADALGIQFYGERLTGYMQVVQSVAPTLATLPAPMQSQPARVLPASPPPSPRAEEPSYLVSSATLAQAYAQLTRQGPGDGPEPEWMLAVTGIKQDTLRTLEHLIDVKLATQSTTRAAFDMQDFARIALTLHEQGLALHAIFHSHRFAGPPQPSEVDWRLQTLLDKGGYPAIQAVFSEDGYVRFFARQPFTVTVYGKGVEHVDREPFLYRLTHFGTVPHAGNVAAFRRDGVALRPLSTHSGR